MRATIANPRPLPGASVPGRRVKRRGMRMSVLRNTRAIVVDREFNEIGRALPRAHPDFTRARAMFDRVIEQIAERNVKGVRICV